MATQVALSEHLRAQQLAMRHRYRPQPSSSKTQKETHQAHRVRPLALYRRSFQGAFLVLNLWLGAKFYFWVRQFEVGVIDSNLQRPPGVEGWLPIAGLDESEVLAVERTDFRRCILQRCFCCLLSWPWRFCFAKRSAVGFVRLGPFPSICGALGKKMFKRNFFLPRWLDLPLRGLKYFLLGFFVWAISTMSAVGIRDFMVSPYGLIADVKMLNFFRHIGETGLIVLGIFVVASRCSFRTSGAGFCAPTAPCWD